MTAPDLDALLVKATGATPATVDLVYVEYDSQLTSEQICSALDGDEASAWNNDYFMEWECDSRWQHVKELLEEVLPDDDERAAFEGSAQFDTWRELVHDRDRSNPYDELLRHTGRRMLEFDLGLDVETGWASTAADCRSAAQAIARAAGIGYRINKTVLDELVANASYGGRLHVLVYTDVAQVVRGVNAEDVVHRAVFTDPRLLVHDRCNGSGHDVRVQGTVRVDLLPEVVRLDEGSYSYSDDIAGVVRGAYQSDLTITATRKKKSTDERNGS